MDHEDALEGIDGWEVTDRQDLRLEDFEGWDTPEVQQLFLELWDETDQARQ